MNLRQMAVVLLGMGVCFACLTALVVPHAGWRALEREYRLLGGTIIVSAAPAELLSFVVLVLAVPLTVLGALALGEKQRE